RRHGAANAGAEADRHVDGVDVGHPTEELEGVARDARGEAAVEGRHGMESALSRKVASVLVGGLEIMTVLDELGTLRAHGRVLLAAIALGYHDYGGKADTAAGEGDALAVVAAGRRDHAGELGLAPFELGQVDDAAADLEGAERRVVLVLDPDLGTHALREQGPA